MCAVQQAFKIEGLARRPDCQVCSLFHGSPRGDGLVVYSQTRGLPQLGWQLAVLGRRARIAWAGIRQEGIEALSGYFFNGEDVSSFPASLTVIPLCFRAAENSVCAEAKSRPLNL